MMSLLRSARRLGAWPSNWCLTILLMATVPWLILTKTLLESRPNRMYFYVTFAIERYEYCDSKGDSFRKHSFNQKRDKVVKLFNDHGLIDDDQIEDLWPYLKKTFATEEAASNWRADYDWLSKYIESDEMRKYYHRKASQIQCTKLQEMMNRKTVKTGDKIELETEIINTAAAKFRDGKIDDYTRNDDNELEFTARMINRTKLGLDYITFWFDALLASDVNESLRLFHYPDHDPGPLGRIKRLIEDPTMSNFLKIMEMWPSNWTDDYTVFQQMYYDALEAENMLELKKRAKRYDRPGNLRELPAKLLELLEVDNFGAVMRLTARAFHDRMKADGFVRGYFLRNKLTLYLMATDKVYEAMANGEFDTEPDPPPSTSSSTSTSTSSTSSSWHSSGLGHKLYSLLTNSWTLAAGWFLIAPVAVGAYQYGRNSIYKSTGEVQTTTEAAFKKVIKEFKWTYISVGALLLVVIAIVGYWYYKTQEDSGETVTTASFPASPVIKKKAALKIKTRATTSTPNTKTKASPATLTTFGAKTSASGVMKTIVFLTNKVTKNPKAKHYTK